MAAAARECEQGLRQRGRPLGDVVDELEGLALVVVGLVHGEIADDELDAEDQVVEVVRDPTRQRADGLELLRGLEATLALLLRLLGFDFARDIEERDDDVRDRIADRSRERTNIDPGAIGTMNRDVVDHDDPPLLERAHEGHLRFGIALTITPKNAVRNGVAADLRRHGTDPHDLAEGAVRVDLLAARRAGDPQPDRQIFTQRVDDVVVAGYDGHRQPRTITPQRLPTRPWQLRGQRKSLI
jgi:hypothetical protein